MNGLAKCLWALGTVGLLLGLTVQGVSCDVDGVTPNCSADGGECLTAPGDAFPAPDAGTD